MTDMPGNMQRTEQTGGKNKEQTGSKGNIGTALLRLQQSFPEEETEEDTSLQDFFRELRRPRGKEYIEQVKRCMELSRKIAELKDELAKERSNGENNLSAKADIQKSKSAPAWLPKATTAATTTKTIEWKGSNRNRLQEELDRLEWELLQQQKQLYDRLPKGDPYLASVFLTDNKAELLRRGIISSEGLPYSGAEELCQLCNAITEQERVMLRLGDRALEECPTPLVVEIYLHAVCKVFGDGSVQLIRG